jgi:hypothetical protein
LCRYIYKILLKSEKRKGKIAQGKEEKGKGTQGKEKRVKTKM